MDPPHTQFVVTPWRDSKELLRLRHDLYGSDATKKERAVNKVFAWRLRKPNGLPLLLDSTADVVDVRLQDEKHSLNHNALRLLYATALSRFITGLADTQIDLTRDRPSWFLPGRSLQLPLALLELRHRIVHRHLPSLAELKRAAQESLDWLWEWYWSQLDYAFGTTKSEDDSAEVEGLEMIKEKLQGILKPYVKERKGEIKTRKNDLKAAETAVSTYNLRYAPNYTSTAPARTQNLFMRLLVDEKMILPTDKKLGASMSGAFLIWDPLLLAFCQSVIPVPTLLNRLVDAMNAPSSSRAMIATEMDTVKEGLYEWISHILCSDEWSPMREIQTRNLTEDTLTTCFSAPTHWNLKVAETLLRDENVADKEQWLAMLEAAKSESSESDDMEVDVEMIEEAIPVEQDKKIMVEKIKGPRKAIGMWRPRPIGWIPEGWEDDE